MGGLGCDNMTCVLVCLLHDQPYQTLVDKCVQTIKARDPTREEEEKTDNTSENTEIQDLTWSRKQVQICDEWDRHNSEYSSEETIDM